jgi:hypothetical protein
VNKKLVIVPEEAETVRTMFQLYLECGSVGALAEELARRNIVSRVRTFTSGRAKGGGPYSVGALAHFLKNRFYIGEVVFRGETHTGEHASIIDRPTFEAAQAKLAENARIRRVVRVPAIQLEKLVVEAIRAKAWPGTEPKGGLSDRGVIDRYVTRVIARPNSIDIELKEPTPAPTPSLATEAPVTAGAVASSTCTTVVSLPWSTPAFASVKGVLHQPEAKPTLKQETRDAILLAVAKARSWIDGIASGGVRSFAEIAERAGKVERHIRVLTGLAFIPPRTLAAIIDGTGRHDVTVTTLAQAVPYRWDGSPVD